MSVVHFSYVHDRGTVRWYGGECFVLLVGVLQQSMLQLSFFRVFYFLSIGKLSICASPLSATPHCCYIFGYPSLLLLALHFLHYLHMEPHPSCPVAAIVILSMLSLCLCRSNTVAH
ncbi:hypothetical protein ASPFODRAFT_531042 [Aspergillus luchuensis CBS 106.47]|uniref:Uncharacterized protein n=1 Tax=Aspergillus luchuensis (strain CBS 106.47) TaxID=1137211 RepID=A0A1M3TNC2_ASPLC|nr:hypothetical protein ASPFODRAFT_531042 [Aspergillus luchuensis CBS 106.47]